ncbi:hypothetical protein Tco_1433501 [Tanacetum coccineum]
MSRYYTFDENNYPQFLYDDGTEMDLLAFIHVADPTKVKVVEREYVKGEVKLLDSTIGHVVPLLPVAPAHAESKLEASVNQLFDKGGDADKGDSATGRGNDAEIEPVTTSEDTATKLRGGHGASSGVATGGKSPFVVRELLANSLLNVEAGVKAVATLPFIPLITLVHMRPRLKLLLLLDAKLNPPLHASMFDDSDSVGMVKPDVAGPSHLPGKELSLGSREIRDMDYEQFERKRLELECVNQANLLKAKDDEVERLKAQLLLKEAERNVALENEKNSLDGKNDGLVDQVHALKTTCSDLHERLSGYENLTEQLEEFQDAQVKVVNGKVAKLDADLAEMACHLEEKFYPRLLTTISGRRWLRTYGLKLVLVKCLNPSEYLIALGAAVSRAIEKGVQDGLATGIDHGREGRSLTNVAAYNPFGEADFNSAL